jgi:choline kinase
VRKQHNYNDLSIIIPAAGLGQRIKLTSPKALLDVRGRTILERQLTTLREAFQQGNIYVIGGFEGGSLHKAIQEWEVSNSHLKRISFINNPRHEETNVAYSVSLGLHASVDERVLVVMGDLVFNSFAIPKPLKESCVVIDSKGQMRDFEVGLILNRKTAKEFSYGISPKWCQLVYLQNRELRLFRHFCSEADKEKFFLFEILNNVIDYGGLFKVIEPPNMEIYEIDTFSDLKKTQERITF